MITHFVTLNVLFVISYLALSFSPGVVLDAGAVLRDVLCEHGDAADLRDHADGAARAGRLPLEVPLTVRKDILILRRLLGK